MREPLVVCDARSGANAPASTAATVERIATAGRATSEQGSGVQP